MTRMFRLRSTLTRALGTAMLPVLLANLSVSGQTTLTEAQAKAAFVLNFARYVDWPATVFASAQAPLVACVIGRDTIGPALTALEGRPVKGRALKVRRGVAIDDMHGCHVVFIGEPEERRVVPVLRALANQPVLTVGDADRFIDVGGAIGLVAIDERLQFEINRSALEQAQLKASASLLKLARNINP